MDIDKEIEMLNVVCKQCVTVFFMLSLYLLGVNSVHGLQVSAVSVPVGESYTVDYAPAHFLQEKLGENGDWEALTGKNKLVVVSGKPEGVYYYRAGTIIFRANQVYYSSTISVSVYSGEPVVVDSLSAQEQYQFQTRWGDINSDGMQDLYVKRIVGGDPSNGVLNETILQQQTDGTFSVLTASAGQLSVGSAWPVANVETVVSDFNLDGNVDLLLKGIASSLPGVNDQMIFSTGQLFNGAAKVVTKIDDEFVKTFSAITNWLGDSDYFENNIITLTGTHYVWVYGCSYNYFYEQFVCGYQRVLEPYTITGYDASLISQDAVDVRDAIENASQTGELVLDALSDPAKALADILEDILGDTIFGGVLKAGGILKVEVDAGLSVGSPDLDDTRGIVLRVNLGKIGEKTGTFNYRSLTSGEILMALDNDLPILGAHLVLVKRYGDFGEKVVVFDGHIFIPDRNTVGFSWSEDYSVNSTLVSTIEQGLFVHELAHVYQQRTLGWGNTKVALQQVAANDNYCYAPLVPGQEYSNYNQEQQAEMVSDRFLLNKGFPQKLSCNREMTLQELDGVIDL